MTRSTAVSGRKLTPWLNFTNIFAPVLRFGAYRFLIFHKAMAFSKIEIKI